MILRRLVWLIKQLLPFTYRNRYWDTQHRQHLVVWRQWFGRVFQVDDVVILYDYEMERRCIEAYERGDYRTLQHVIDALQDQFDLGEVPVWVPPPARMQSLQLANDLWGDLHLGRRITVRAGRRDIRLGPLMLESTLPDAAGQHLREIVDVTEVRHKRFRDLTDTEAEDDGATDADEMREALRRFYPALGPDDEITLVCFKM
jgi:hypothetical protein